MTKRAIASNRRPSHDHSSKDCVCGGHSGKAKFEHHKGRDRKTIRKGSVYKDEAVKRILAARDAPPEASFTNADDLMEWLHAADTEEGKS